MAKSRPLTGFVITKFTPVKKTEKITKNALASGYAKMAKAMEKDLKEAVNTPGPSPSTNGSPPHKQTGKLQGSIIVNAPKDGSGVTLRSVKYGVYLEDPENRGLNRKWIKPTISENRAKYKKIVRDEVKKLAHQKAKKRKKRRR